MLPAITDPESLTPVTGAETRGSDASTATDATLELLGDRRRRAVLQYLDDRADDAPVPVADLADHVTLAEEGQETGPIASCGDALLGIRRRVRISLRHHHVPKLADAGAVDFDLEANTVTLRETGAELVAQATTLESERQTDDDRVPAAQ